MPELPEVETVVVTLRPRLVGRTISRVTVARQDILQPPEVDFPALVSGREIRSIDRRGKRIIFTLDDGNRFFVHLGMTGRLVMSMAQEPIEKHTHVIWDFKSQISILKSGISNLKSQISDHKFEAQLRFRDPRRFGGIWWLGTADCDAGMGPEPLTTRTQQLAQRLAQTTRAIKSALLDQQVLAGLGNIYVDESLFAARIHPLTPANQLGAELVAALNRAIKAILRRAIRHRGSTFRDYRDAEGNAGGFQLLHRVYDREGKPCRVCKTPIERIVLGGRSTHFCPHCQRMPIAEVNPKLEVRSSKQTRNSKRKKN
jgi:formamidopyrimidine-DNA glycosylase